MTNFAVHGPFEIDVVKGKGGRTISKDAGPDFWDRRPSVALHKGCYVFAIQNGRGTLPTYVGKATVSFRQEVFTPHKLSHHYHPALCQYAKGKAVLFFVVKEKAKGPTPKSVIDDLETYLIEQCSWRNPHGFTNTRKLPKAEWSIAGVVRSGRGKPSEAAKKFRLLIERESS